MKREILRYAKNCAIAGFVIFCFGLFLSPLIVVDPTLVSAALEDQQTTSVQVDIFAGEIVTTTAKTQAVACGHGNGSIGRKTVTASNAGGESTGAVTITVELRDRLAGENFTTGYMAINNLLTDTITYTAKTPTTDTAGRFCLVSATSAETSSITVTLRKE